MAFDNHYPNRKDHRRPYRDVHAWSVQCRCHGVCHVCMGNRTFADWRRAPVVNEDEVMGDLWEWKYGGNERFTDYLAWKRGWPDGRERVWEEIDEPW